MSRPSRSATPDAGHRAHSARDRTQGPGDRAQGQGTSAKSWTSSRRGSSCTATSTANGLAAAAIPSPKSRPNPDVIDGGIPASGMVAHTLISRFADHLPYYRQEDINARAGVHTPRSTLSAWGGSGGAALQPLYEAQKRFVLSAARSRLSQRLGYVVSTDRRKLLGVTTTEGRDTVNRALEYRLRPLERAVDTVIALQDMPISPSNRCREPSMSEIESKQPWEVLSNATVNLSVSCPFSDVRQHVFPLSGDRLLTIEWE